MTALFLCDMDIYSKGRLVIRNNKKSKNKVVVLVVEIIFFFCVNATHVEVSAESVLGQLIHTSHSYTNAHTHTYVQIHHGHRHHACRAYPDMCVDVFVPKVCVQSVYGCVCKYPAKATLYT